MNAYINHTERFQIKNIMLNLKFLEKNAKHKTSRSEIIKIRNTINKIETKKKE
jgi:hypothetical protein